MSIVENHQLPEILDQILERRVFTHRSITGMPRGQLEDEEPSEDNDRLSFLGSGVIQMVATAVIEEQRPLSRAGDLDEKRSLLVSRARLASLSDAYGLPQRLRVHGAQRELIPRNEKAKAEVFQAYVAAIWKEATYERVEEWLGPLFEQELNEILAALTAEEEKLVSSFADATLGEPSERRSADKAPAEPPVAVSSLAAFNTLCQKKHIRPVWSFTQGGLLHAPEFIATVRLPGEGAVIGTGRGGTKKMAEQQAAQEALAALR